jgi:hypothetical protein
MMDCIQTEKLLLLYKEGERNAEEQKALDQHLLECEKCRQLAESISRMESRMEEFRQSLPQGSMDAEAIQTITRLTTDMEDMNLKDRPRIVHFHISPVNLLRYAASILITVSISLFLFQNYQAMQHLSQLETQFGKHTVQTVTLFAQKEPSVEQIMKKVDRLARSNSLTHYTSRFHKPLADFREAGLWRELCSRNPKACEQLVQQYYKNLKEAYQ